MNESAKMLKMLLMMSIILSMLIAVLPASASATWYYYDEDDKIAYIDMDSEYEDYLKSYSVELGTHKIYCAYLDTYYDEEDEEYYGGYYCGKGYLNFVPTVTGYYRITVSNLNAEDWDEANGSFSLMLVENGDLNKQTVDTEGGKNSTLWLGNTSDADSYDLFEQNLESRYGEIKLTAGQKLFINLNMYCESFDMDITKVPDPTPTPTPTPTTAAPKPTTAAPKPATTTAAKPATKPAAKTKTLNKKGKIKTLKSTKKMQISLKWKKISGVTGYQFYFSQKKNFKSKTLQRKYKKSKTSDTINHFPSKKTFYVKMRPYKKSGGKTIYGKWSKVKKVKIK
ncbi:MAG: hypothetical protein IJ137_10255 [Eubacterium sp.]|nr:hypothetical protein [Eubacterium sp.]